MPSLVLNNQQTVEYQIKSNRLSKSVRLNVYPDGRVLITKPRYVSLRQARLFIQDKLAWLSEQLANLGEGKERAAPQSRNQADYLQRRESARLLVKERLEYFNQFYHFSYQRISIRNQSTRWGSCSRQANLNFNYRLLDLTPLLRDYLVVHELCHLREFNHSPKFWLLVAKTIPDYQKKRRELHHLSLLSR